LESSRVAAVWRRSCNRTLAGRPALFEILLKCWLRDLGRMGAPSGLGKTRSARFTLSLLFLYLSSKLTACGVREMLLLPLTVFGCPKESPRSDVPFLLSESDLLTRSTCASKSMSSHLRAKISPRQRPVVTARVKSARSRSLAKLVRSCWTCSVQSGCTSSFFSLGGCTNSVTFLLTYPHLIAWSQALCNVTWTY
jgi:hypothetical protein